jgi:hypothetical protein
VNKPVIFLIILPIMLFAGCGAKHESGAVLYAESNETGHVALVDIGQFSDLMRGDVMEGTRKIDVTHPITGEHLDDVEEGIDGISVDYVLENMALVESVNPLAEGDMLRIKDRSSSQTGNPIQTLGEIIDVDLGNRHVVVQLLDESDSPSPGQAIYAAAPVEIVNVAFRMKPVCRLYDPVSMTPRTVRYMVGGEGSLPVDGDVVVRISGNDRGEWFEEINRFMPESAIQTRQLNLAIRKMNQGLYSEVVHSLEGLEEAWEQMDIGLGEIQYIMGACYSELGDAVKAKTYLDLAIRTLPDDPRPLLALGWLQMEINQVDKSIETLEKAANLMPDCDRIWMDIGDLYVSAGKTEKAIACYRKAQSINPDGEEAKWELENTASD